MKSNNDIYPEQEQSENRQAKETSSGMHFGCRAMVNWNVQDNHKIIV